MLLLLLACTPRTSTTCTLLPCLEVEDSALGESGGSDSEGEVPTDSGEAPDHVAQLVDKGLYYDSIQAAIAEAADGDVVLVQPGTHYERIDFHGKGIRVTSAEGPATTVLDGMADGSVVEIRAMEPETAILEGFTITNGEGTEAHGGGVFVENADPVIQHNIIRGNSARIGGGVYLRHGQATVRNNLILDNVASEGGGGLTCTNCKGLITYNTFAGNTAKLGPFAEIYFEPEGDFIANLVVLPEDVDMAVRFLEPMGYTFLFQYNLRSEEDIPWVEEENPWIGDFPDDGTNGWGEPVFGEDYRLEAGSAGIDEGPPEETDTDGSRADVGAYGGPWGDWP